MTGTAQSRAWLVAGGLATAIVMQAGRTAAEGPQVEAPKTSPPKPAAASPGASGEALRMPQRLPVLGAAAEPITAGRPTTPEQRKDYTLRWMAAARAALDRGDLRTATTMVAQAKALGVPDAAFAPGEPRLWQLELDVDAAARRAGFSAGSVAQAGGLMPPGGPTAGSGGQVANAQYPPAPYPPGVAGGPTSQVVPAQATGPAPFATPSATPLAPVGGNSPGEKLYQDGIRALTAGDRQRARDLFAQAWKYEAELDANTRRQLQDKLQLLQQPAGAASAPTDQQIAAMSPLETVDLQRQQLRQRLYSEVTSELAVAYKARTEAPLDALDRIERLRRRVVDAAVDPAAQQQLLAMVDRAIAEQRKYVTENRAQIDLDLQNDQVRRELDTERMRKSEIDDKIAELVETYNDLMEERRFPEAEVVAKQVGELAPGSPIARMMFQSSRTGTRIMMNEEIQAEKEEMFAEHMLDVDRSNRAPRPGQPLEFMDAREWGVMSMSRLSEKFSGSKLSPAEQEIKRRLETKVDVRFRNQPIAEVMKTLEAVAGVPIFLDQKALSAAQVTSETPVTLDLNQAISLQSALELMLGQFDLTYTIRNEVLNITSREAKQSQVYPEVYKVSDLVMPIPNFQSSYEDGLAGALRNAYQMTTDQMDVTVAPVSLSGLAAGQSANTNPNMLAQYGIPGMGQISPYGRPQMGMPGGAGGGAMADFTQLMTLIQTTIEPDKWLDLYAMQPYPQNLSLVISTTSDVHDQIADLLESLRRLQNLQVTIEVRFISLSDSFFEQIGVDFDVHFDDNVSQLPQDDSGPSVTIGLGNNNGTPTPDLDLRFEQNNFNVSTPIGGIDPGALSTFGFAILSDIEAFFFLQAAQGDDRTNVMQAPKVTLFDGQSATIQDTVQRPFVTSIRPVVGDFAVAQQPIIVVLNEGTQLNVQAVVSHDKRFVRLTLVPFFSQITDVDTFTFEGRRTSRSGSETIDPETGEPIETDESEDVIQGTTVQLPSFASTSVQTTVSVPDGGTILLGGIKRLAEGRVERGVPMLSKIPYISRLFKNVAVGRDSQSLMLMVTPRIIIQEEEEIAQTGFDPTR